MVFHKCSKQIYDWMKNQQHVKEESLTDWLLYNISQKCPYIHYQAFSRHEEAQNGSDWEWWILTSDSSRRYGFNAYRFVVQAKKLLPNNKDNYPLVNYGNKNGLQIDLLMNFAKSRNALPLYMYYSIGESDVMEQIKNINYISKGALMWCENCANGSYLSLAQVVHDMIYKIPRRKVLDSQLLNNSFKLSILDLFNGKNTYEIDQIFNDFNSKLLEYKIVEEGYYSSGVHGIKFDKKSIPEYVKLFIENKGEIMEWFEEEMKITDISGLGIIDFRGHESGESIY